MIPVKWKPVIGLEDRYEVSNDGQVRSLRWRKGLKAGDTEPKIKKHFVTGPGYQNVKLWDGKRHFTALVHRLVYEAFVGPIPPGIDVHHIDHDPSNNCVDNLTLATRRANIREAIKRGTHVSVNPVVGELHNRARLDDIQIMWMRQLSDEGKSPKELAQIFNVSHQSVWRILSGNGRRTVNRTAAKHFLGNRKHVDPPGA